MKIKRIFLSLIAGIGVGLLSALFLVLLDWTSSLRDQHPNMIYALPLAGLIIGLGYHYLGKEVSRGYHLILEEIYSPKKVVPFKLIPMVLLGTLITHLFGGSAGREGTALQMGATFSDQLNRWFKITADDRKVLLMAGTSAGFGATIGAPFAGWIFGLELIAVVGLSYTAWLECLIASLIGYYTVILVGVHHTLFEAVHIQTIEVKTVLWVSLAGTLFGLAARLFSRVVYWVELANFKFIPYPPLRPFCVGTILVIGYFWEGSFNYVGLGFPTILKAFTVVTDWEVPLFKTFFTALTVGSGFKGGEFVPLVFVGTTLGSALSVMLPLSFKLLAALGFVALYAGAANTPIAATILAMELFGYEIGLYALVACCMSYLVSGPTGIYKNQKRFQLFRFFKSI